MTATRIVKPPADEPLPGSVGGLAARGAVALGLRQAAVTLLSVGVNVALAHQLSAADYGRFSVVVLLGVALATLGDGGLGASVVRQREAPTTRVVQALFTVQLGLATTILALAVIPIGPEGIDRDLVRWIALGLPAMAHRAMSVALLERRLDFGRVGVVHVAETVAFSVGALVVAFSGADPALFGAAFAVQALVGALTAWTFARWPLGLARTDDLRDRLSFGALYQGVAGVSFLKDLFAPVLVGLVVGATAVGYVRWATLFAAYATLALMILSRLYLPLFARLDDPVALRRPLGAVLVSANAVVAPIALASLAFAHPLTSVLFGDKWLPALPLFYLLWTANLVVPTSTPLLALMQARGQERPAFLYACLWAAMTWGLGTPLVALLGDVGFGIANVLVQLTAFGIFRAARRLVDVELLGPFLRVWIPAAVAVAPFSVLWLLVDGTAIVGLLLAVVACVAGFVAVGLSNRSTVAAFQRAVRS